MEIEGRIGDRSHDLSRGRNAGGEYWMNIWTGGPIGCSVRGIRQRVSSVGGFPAVI